MARCELRADIERELSASRAVVEGCLRRAKYSVYWPSMISELRHWSSSCEPCRLFEISHGKETLTRHEVPQRPWEKVAVDLFTLEEKDYLVTVDHYSAGLLRAGQTAPHRSRSFDQVTKGSFCKARQSLQTCKRKRSTIRCGRISEIHKGLGHQTHTNNTSSKANGKVEAVVKSAKRLLRKTAKGGDDLYLGRLAERHEYSITRHWEQSCPVTHEKEVEDSSSHNWKSAGEKEPAHKLWERSWEMCKKGKLATTIPLLMTYPHLGLWTGEFATFQIRSHLVQAG